MSATVKGAAACLLAIAAVAGFGPAAKATPIAYSFSSAFDRFDYASPSGFVVNTLGLTGAQANCSGRPPCNSVEFTTNYSGEGEDDILFNYTSIPDPYYFAPGDFGRLGSFGTTDGVPATLTVSLGVGSVSSVPEPRSIWLLMAGLAGLLAVGRAARWLPGER